MKLIDALKEWHTRDDFDVIAPDCWIAYCGTGLTKEGLKIYSNILELDCEFIGGCIPHLAVNTTTDEQNGILERMLLDMAGYCSVSWHEKHFTDEIDV